MGENVEQGISRRELLRRGAVLGGAVVWTTPVVQTLGMGRAFAQTASPEGGKDISYLVIHWKCGGDEYHTKFENGQPQAGRTPDCELALSGSTAANLRPGITVGAVNGPCVSITVDQSVIDEGCEILEVLLKAGSSSTPDNDPCQAYPLVAGTNPYCTV